MIWVLRFIFLYSHLDEFPGNCGDLSDVQGERFHQDIKTMEEHYKGRWDKRMMAATTAEVSKGTMTMKEKCYHSSYVHEGFISAMSLFDKKYFFVLVYLIMFFF